MLSTRCWGATLLLVPFVLGEYVVPLADGSDGWADAFSKAKALVSQMTLEEKLNMTQQNNYWPRVGEVDRLGYTGLYYADGSEGIRGLPFASAFDMALNGAASFDRQLLYRRAVAIGEEARGKGINTQFGPGVNLLRVPEAGRASEYYGADPYLAGQAAAEHVKGVQSQNVMAMMRHFIGNEQEDGRTFINSIIDDRTAHELYLWPFQDAVHAGVVSAMCAYNGVNGSHACSNKLSLGKWLHDELNFQGFVLSDYGAVFLGGEVDAANAGCDSVIGNSQYPYNGSMSTSVPFGPGGVLAKAIAAGNISESRLDDMATRIAAAWYKVGQDQDFPPLVTGKNVLSVKHNELIRELGAKSAVLLKNEGTLPLKNLSYLYVFGNSATVDLYGFPRPQLGPASGPDSDQGVFAGGQGSSYANLPYLITPFEALQQRARQCGSQVFGYFDNYNHTVQASYAAKANTVGAPCLVDVRQQCSEGYDRANLSASWEGDQTILAVAGGCNQTVVLYSACGPFNVTSWVDHPNVTAIINAGGAGQEAGNALVDVLYGDVNPSARLPYTIGYKLSDYPATVNPQDTVPLNTTFINITYSEGLFIDYRWFDKHNITPAFDFGFGLSYTTFNYSGLSIETLGNNLAPRAAPNASSLFDNLARVTVEITNSGSLDGTEIPQLYLGSPAAGAPNQVLRGFEAVHLAAGESTSVVFNLTRRDLSYWDTSIEGWTLPGGDYTINVGASSRDIRSVGTLSLSLQ